MIRNTVWELCLSGVGGCGDFHSAAVVAAGNWVISTNVYLSLLQWGCKRPVDRACQQHWLNQYGVKILETFWVHGKSWIFSTCPACNSTLNTTGPFSKRRFWLVMVEKAQVLLITPAKSDGSAIFKCLVKPRQWSWINDTRTLKLKQWNTRARQCDMSKVTIKAVIAFYLLLDNSCFTRLTTCIFKIWQNGSIHIDNCVSILREPDRRTTK